MKGCFTDTSCNNTKCVDNSIPKVTNFCCCTGHMCNSQFKLLSTTTKAPEIEELAPPPKDSTMAIAVLICCGVAFVISVLFAGVFFYKSKKKALFNEIPTVSDNKFVANRLSQFIQRSSLCFFLLPQIEWAGSAWIESKPQRTSTNSIDWSEGKRSFRCCVASEIQARWSRCEGGARREILGYGAPNFHGKF